MKASLLLLVAATTIVGFLPVVFTSAQNNFMVPSEQKFTKTLQRGMNGVEVEGLQKFLKQFHDLYPEGMVSGYFGMLTEQAVIKFQQKYGIEQLGIVGPKTRSALNELSAKMTLSKPSSSIPFVSQQILRASHTPSVATLLTTKDRITLPTDITIGNDGNPVIAYYSAIDLSIVFCSDETCTGPVIKKDITNSMHTNSESLALLNNLSGDSLTVIESDSGAFLNICKKPQCNGHVIKNIGWGNYFDIAIEKDGLPLIVFLERTATSGRWTGWELKLFHCGDVWCESGNSTATLDRFDYRITGQHPMTRVSLAIDSDGLPVIAYQGNQDERGVLKILKCGNIVCSSGNTIFVADENGDTGLYPSLAIGRDGFPIIGYFQRDLSAWNYELHFLHCGTTTCTSGNSITVVDDDIFIGRNITLMVGADGLPLLVYDTRSLEAYSWDSDFKAAHCNNLLCTASTTITKIERIGNIGNDSSVVIGKDGLPIISFADLREDGMGTDLRVFKCGDAACSLLPEELKPNR